MKTLKQIGIVFVVLFALAIVTQKHQSNDPTPKPSETTKAEKVPEILESLNTPVGPLIVTKYKGDDPCLYTRATQKHIDYYGMDELKRQLKDRYSVSCVIWETAK